MPTGSVNEINYNLDQTVRIFDQFYQFEQSVPAAEYDVVYSYFLSVMSNATVAGNFAGSMFQVAKETKIPPLTLLAEFKGLSGVNLSASLAYYLNLVRSRAALLGIGVATVPNFYAARAVIQ